MYLAEGMKPKAITDRLEIAPATLWRWRNNDELFKIRVKQLMQDATTEAIEKIKVALNDAVDTIIEISKGEYEDVQEGRLNFTAAKWLAERVLNPAQKGTTEPTTDAGRRVREVAVELDRLTGEDTLELLERGLE